jgi:hypothetical protein
VLAAAAQGEAAFECKEEGFFVNPDDCSLFYRCVDNDGMLTKFDFQCGPGTLFDESLGTCVSPWDESDPRCRKEDQVHE